MRSLRLTLGFSAFITRWEFLFLSFALMIFHPSNATVSERLNSDSLVQGRYEKAYNSISDLLITDGSFKSAVFQVEKAFYQIAPTEVEFSNSITQLTKICKYLFESKRNTNSLDIDSANFLMNYSIFSAIHDTVYFLSDSLFIGHKPYCYNHIDPNGRKDWSNTFVSKLLKTHYGNCQSLVFLYKIVADELKVKCWFALAPNHIYIRNYSEKNGWYNTELTSGVFPTDAWLAMTGYISTDAIRQGVYMDTLSNKQSIGLCVIDLAKSYEFQTHNYYDGFIIKCCDLVLKYHSVNPQALLLKAETLQKVYIKQQKENNINAVHTYSKMEEAYIALAKLGYREMPEKMYLQWLQSAVKEKDKYTNKQVMHVQGN